MTTHLLLSSRGAQRRGDLPIPIRSNARGKQARGTLGHLIGTGGCSALSQRTAIDATHDAAQGCRTASRRSTTEAQTRRARQGFQPAGTARRVRAAPPEIARRRSRRRLIGVGRSPGRSGYLLLGSRPPWSALAMRKFTKAEQDTIMNFASGRPMSFSWSIECLMPSSSLVYPYRLLKPVLSAL